MKPAAAPVPHGVETCVIQAVDAFPDPADLHAARPERYPHLLESVAHGTPQGRYDILFAFPGDTLALEPDGTLHGPGAIPGGDFLVTLDDLWRATAGPASSEIPFTGGWLLYLGYELARAIEPGIGHMPAGEDLPVAFATRFPAAIIRDHLRSNILLVAESSRAAELIPTMRADVLAHPPAHDASLDGISLSLREDAPADFLQSVERILEYIRAGDVFQVNLSRAWRGVLRDSCLPVDIYRRLRRANPAPFAGLLTLGARKAVISSSPERLVEVRGGNVRTRPIAGTSPRSRDREQDEAWSRALLRHPKERAEHVMLVDLERNDVGRVCDPGTVEVSEFMALESYAHVHHIVSGVEGRLRAGVTPGEIIRAVFPGGTITGCPKVRTMQIIAQLEQTGRGAYTGSMGYLNHDGSMDLNILIRTLVQNGREIHLRAGSGIVADSDPERELNETRAKAKGLLAALNARESPA